MTVDPDSNRKRSTWNTTSRLHADVFPPLYSTSNSKSEQVAISEVDLRTIAPEREENHSTMPSMKLICFNLLVIALFCAMVVRAEGKWYGMRPTLRLWDRDGLQRDKLYCNSGWYIAGDEVTTLEPESSTDLPSSATQMNISAALSKFFDQIGRC